MADLSRDQIHRLARLGAQARLAELQKEEAAIRQAFPDLFGRKGRRARRSAKRRRRSTMSAAARRAVSVRMKKYWADRRKTKK